jgi:N-acetyl sugar amidotransferase
MDTTDSKITFDENGVCDHCNTFKKRVLPIWHPDENSMTKMQKLAEKIKQRGKGKDFDCIIGMSGGVDSSYLVYLAKEKLGLRPLVFHVDAGWNSQQAVNNIERIVDKLGLDLYTEVIDWEEMKDLQLAFFKSGVSHVDTPQDHAFFATMYKFCSKYKIKYMLTGANYSTECIMSPFEWMYYQSDSTQLKDIHKKFGSKPLKTFPLTNILWHKVYLKYVRGIQVVKPLNYFPYVKEEATQFLEKEFGYQRYAQKHFESRFTKFYEGYWLPEKFGFDTRRVQYSSLILTGQMKRDDALEKLKKPAYDPETIQHDFEYIATKLGITSKELKKYMDEPNKTFRDYKNQYWIYELGSWVMRKLKMKAEYRR